MQLNTVIRACAVLVTCTALGIRTLTWDTAAAFSAVMPSTSSLALVSAFLDDSAYDKSPACSFLDSEDCPEADS